MNASLVKRHFTLDMDESQISFLSAVLGTIEPSSNLEFAELLARFKAQVNECAKVASQPLSFDESEQSIKRYEIDVCDQCLKLEGEMCHNPGCICIRRSMTEVERILSVCQLRINLSELRDQNEEPEQIHFAEGRPVSMRVSI